MNHFKLHLFPPSTNKAYFVRNGRLILSEEGRAFKRQVTDFLVRNYVQDMRVFKKNKPYFVILRMHFEEGIETKGWQKNKCETRYKKFDATNRVKLAEDACKDAMGVDDSQFMGVCTIKQDAVDATGKPIPSWFEVFIWSIEEERSPLDDLNRACSGEL